MKRRSLLTTTASVGLLGSLGGCTGLLGGSDVQDTDGDGVIDSEDYAPRDPEVQEKSDLECEETETQETDAGSQQVLFEDGFESGSLSNWEEVVLPDRRNEDVVDWSTTDNAIEGSYSAYCETVGDNNKLRTTAPVLEFGAPLQITYRWRTAAENSRGINCLVTNGEGENGFESLFRARVGLDKDGNPRVQVNDEEAFFSSLSYGQGHTTTVRIDNGTATVSNDGEELFSTSVSLSGTHYLTFDASGHWGAESTMTLDSVRVERV